MEMVDDGESDGEPEGAMMGRISSVALRIIASTRKRFDQTLLPSRPLSYGQTKGIVPPCQRRGSYAV